MLNISPICGNGSSDKVLIQVRMRPGVLFSAKWRDQRPLRIKCWYGTKEKTAIKRIDCLQINIIVSIIYISETFHRFSEI